MTLPLLPTIPACEAWLNDVWVQEQLMRLLRQAAESLSERGFRAYAGPLAPVVRKSTMGRCLRMAYLFQCSDAVVTLSAQWNLGAFVFNVGAGRGELTLHVGTIADSDVDNGDKLIALQQLWNHTAIALAQRTDNLLADLRHHYEPVFAELESISFEQDLALFVDSVDQAFQT